LELLKHCRVLWIQTRRNSLALSGRLQPVCGGCVILNHLLRELANSIILGLLLRKLTGLDFKQAAVGRLVYELGGGDRSRLGSGSLRLRPTLSRRWRLCRSLG